MNVSGGNNVSFSPVCRVCEREGVEVDVGAGMGLGYGNGSPFP